MRTQRHLTYPAASPKYSAEIILSHLPHGVRHNSLKPYGTKDADVHFCCHPGQEPRTAAAATGMSLLSH